MKQSIFSVTKATLELLEGCGYINKLKSLKVAQVKDEKDDDEDEGCDGVCDVVCDFVCDIECDVLKVG